MYKGGTGMLNINRIGRIMKVFKREYPLTFVYIVIDDRTWTDLVNLHFTLNFKYKSIADKIVKYCENELNLNMSGINYEEKAFIHELGHIVLTKYLDLPSYSQDLLNYHNAPLKDWFVSYRKIKEEYKADIFARDFINKYRNEIFNVTDDIVNTYQNIKNIKNITGYEINNKFNIRKKVNSPLTNLKKLSNDYKINKEVVVC